MIENKIIDFFRSQISNIILILLCLSYILKGLIGIGEKEDASLYSIIADGFVCFIFSIGIKILMRHKGILLGFEYAEFKATCNAYAEQKKQIIPYVQYLENFCYEENKNRIKSKQEEILNNLGIKYEDFIKGYYDLEPIKISKNKPLVYAKYQNELDKYKCCKKAHKVTIVPYTLKLLNNAYDSSKNEDALLKASAKEFQAKKTITNIAIGIAYAIIFGYFGPTKNNVAIEGIIWATLQVALYLVFGFVEQNNAFSFVTKTLREKIKYIMTINDKFLNTKEKYINAKENKENAECCDNC